MPGTVYYELPAVYYLEGALACWGSGMGLTCLGLSIMHCLLSALWMGPGLPGPVYYKLNPCVWSLGWAWHAWACLL
jgi:hypothetical protein